MVTGAFLVPRDIWDDYVRAGDCLLESDNWHLLMTHGRAPDGTRAIYALAYHWGCDSGGNCYSKIVRTSGPLCAVLGEAAPGLGARHRAHTD